MLLQFLAQYFKRLLPRDKSLVFLFAIIQVYFACVIALTVILKYFENLSWIEALWQVWQTYTTVGYGNEPAEGILGRTVTMVFGFFAIALYAAMGGALIEYFIRLKERRKFGLMENPFKNGYVIFNLPEIHLMDSFIEEIRVTEKDVGVCIVDNRIDELPATILVRGKVHFVKGSLVEQETYKKANLEHNKVVIVFPSEPFNPDSDAATKTIVDLTSQFVRKADTRIIHVLVKQSNDWMFKDLPSTSVLESISVLALVQESQDQYSASIIQRLLANTDGANPHTVHPTTTQGLTWKQFQHNALKASEKLNMKANVFALVRNGEPSTCPDFDTVITGDDSISIISYNDFDWLKFETAMTENSKD